MTSSIRVLGQIAFRIGEFSPVGYGFKIQIKGGAGAPYFQGESGFSDLARPKQGNSWIAVDRFHQLGVYPALNHPCNYGISCHNCKEKEHALAASVGDRL